MDSKVLSREQLQLLVKFIHSRGFKEHVVVLEILDHFACKVEEILVTEREMPFDAAMKKAHESFGVMGFKPIAESFHEQVKKKYSRLYWSNFRALLARPLAVVGLPLAGVLFFKAYLWAEANRYTHFFEANDAATGMFLFYLVSQLLPYATIPKGQRRHPFVIYSLTTGMMGFWGVFLLSSFDDVRNAALVPYVAGAMAIAFVYLIARAIALESTVLKAVKDIREIERMAAAQ